MAINRKRQFLKQFRKNKFLLALTLPMVIYTFIFSYTPMFGAMVAFKRYQFDKGILGSEWVGLSNFKFLFTSPDLVRIVRNTLGYNALFIVSTLLASVAIALMLYELTSKKLLKAYQSVMFFPHFLSWVVVAYMVYAFLNPRSGMLNQWFGSLGLEAIDWYNNTTAWIYIFPIASLWKTIGMNAIMYYAALLSVDPTYYEAAKMDGASRWKIITNISLPFLYPLMTILVILAIGHIFSADFGLFYQLPMNSPTLFATTDVIDTYVFRALMELGNIGMSSAADLTKSVLGFILIITVNAVVRKINPDRSLF
ncbi:sugar ABC transporter permease [Paenibacillus sp. 598K]|uniref:ABC transporter permease n=1 Tax=Paenibacillus sp. 598K TaxID=1117987 RepID=UPI000FFABC47|nr:ABC transporter permease subunit [Paenibacillus sp. 598K]GBF77320.1 sugar ABC transporter permease [Paenibacillus sp. 598K]